MTDGALWLRQTVAHLRTPVGQPSADLDRRINAAVRRDVVVRRARRRVGLAVAILGAFGVLWSRAPGFGRTTIEFEIDAPSAGRVSVLGDFNNWDQAGIPMERSTRPGRWRAAVSLPDGWYRYAFLVDRSHWVADPAKPTAPDADFGQPTSRLVVE